MSDKVSCAVCGQCFKQVTKGHIETHGMTLAEYAAKFPDHPRVSSATSAAKWAVLSKRDPEVYRTPEYRAKRSAILKRQYAESDFHAKRMATRGRNDWTGLVEAYPVHWMSFRHMHERTKAAGLEVDPDFVYTPDGFRAVIEYVGPVLEWMEKPTFGRFNHKKGYLRDNFAWQEGRDNSAEAMTRHNRDFLARRKAKHGY